jgi:hypothetical protein
MKANTSFFWPIVNDDDRKTYMCPKQRIVWIKKKVRKEKFTL